MTKVVQHQSTDVPLSIIIPTLNESATIDALLQTLHSYRQVGCEVIVADGGSIDDTVQRAAAHVDVLVTTAKGRALQMNAGAAKASGRWLLFLHADTQLPTNILSTLPEVKSKGFIWGFFPVRLSGSRSIFRVIEWFMNVRSRLTAVATGDQVLLVDRKSFMQFDGFPVQPLMEDVAISKILRQGSTPFVFSEPVVTSSRRWQQRGVLKTILLMWLLRLGYFLGVSPSRLVKVYYGR